MLYICWAWQTTFVILDWRCYFHCDYAAEGLGFENSVYWIRFDEEFADKVNDILLCQLDFHFFRKDADVDYQFYLILTHFDDMVQKFKSSSPFGIKYKFHLEVLFLTIPIQISAFHINKGILLLLVQEFEEKDTVKDLLHTFLLLSLTIYVVELCHGVVLIMFHWDILLQDAVDCPEWIVPFHVFKSLAEEV